MKTITIFVALLAIICLSHNANAQKFLNGDFENNSSGANFCNFNMSNAAFTSTMSNTVAYGVANQCDIINAANSSCSIGFGSSQSGNWFTALAVGISGDADAFTMELCCPLIAGNTYTMSFWDKGAANEASPNPIVIGVSNANNLQGIPVYTGPVPTIGAWNLRTFTFIAPIAGSFISVEIATSSSPQWTNVDNFQIASTCNAITTNAILGSPFCSCTTINVPFTSTGIFVAGNIYSAQLSDNTGSFAAPVTIGSLASTANSGTITCTIPCNTITGSYRVRVVSTAPANVCTNIPVSIFVNETPTVAVSNMVVCQGVPVAVTPLVSVPAGATVTWTNSNTALFLGLPVYKRVLIF